MIPAASSQSSSLRAIPGAASFWAFWVPRLLLFSAALVILARLFAPFQVGKDQAQQLEGAQRLSAGLGITNTSHSPPIDPDITPDPDPAPLTLWPPGLSIAIAALLSCGISLVTSLKLLYSVTTVAGWWGWASICGKLFSEVPAPASLRILRTVPLIAAILLPVFYTPLWSGTDIFLWAGVPWVVLLTNRPAGLPGGVPAAAAAGALVGVLFAFRYAGAFLGIAAGFIILLAAMPQWKELWKRYLAFGVSSLVLAIPVLLFMGSGRAPTAGMYELGVQSSEIINVAEVSHRAGRLIFASPILELGLARINWPPFVYMVGALTVLAVIIAPVLRWAANRRKEEGLVLPLLILPAALVVFLIVVSRGFFLGVPRYYEPVLLCWVLVCVTLCGSRSTVLAWGARGIVALFLAILCGVMPLRAAMKSHRPSVVLVVLGFVPSKTANLPGTSAPVDFPGYGRIFSQKEDTRSKLAELFRKHPEALFLAQNYPLYIFDGLPGGPKPGSQVRPFPVENYWESAFSSINRKVFVVLDADERNPKPRKWVRRVVYRNEWENTLICEIDIQAGQRVLDAALAMPGVGN